MRDTQDASAALPTSFLSTPHTGRPMKKMPSKKPHGSKIPLSSKSVEFMDTKESAVVPGTHLPNPHNTTSQVTGATARNIWPRKKAKKPQERNYLRGVMGSKKCALIGETLDYDGLFDNKPQCTFISPDVLFNDMKDITNGYHVWLAIKQAMERNGTTESRVALALDLVLVQLGIFQLERYPDAHFTFVDPRLAMDETGIVNKVLILSKAFEDKGVARSRIVFNIPATLPGIKAAKKIARFPPVDDSIKTNLILVQGLSHAAACIEAAPFAITLSVGAVLRWHEGASLKLFPSLHPSVHPGMGKLHSIRLYVELNRIPVKVIAGDCRKLEEIEHLVDFPGIVLPLPRMTELRWATTERSENDSDPLPVGSKFHVIAGAAAFPGDCLSKSEAQAKGDPPLIPEMSLQTQQMAEHNINQALAAMEEKMNDIEAYIHKEVLKWEERMKPYKWRSPVPSPGCDDATVPNTPVKKEPWNIQKNDSLTWL